MAELLFKSRIIRDHDCSENIAFDIFRHLTFSKVYISHTSQNIICSQIIILTELILKLSSAAATFKFFDLQSHCHGCMFDDATPVICILLLLSHVTNDKV